MIIVHYNYTSVTGPVVQHVTFIADWNCLNDAMCIEIYSLLGRFYFDECVLHITDFNNYSFSAGQSTISAH